MRRPSSNSTTLLRIVYGSPNSFIDTPNVSPRESRSGPLMIDCTDPEPSMRGC